MRQEIENVFAETDDGLIRIDLVYDSDDPGLQIFECGDYNDMFAMDKNPDAKLIAYYNDTYYLTKNDYKNGCGLSISAWLEECKK